MRRGSITRLMIRCLGGGLTMTDEEWVQQALSTMPPISATKKMRLASLFREEPTVAKVFRFERDTFPAGKKGELDNFADDHPAAV